MLVEGILLCSSLGGMDDDDSFIHPSENESSSPFLCSFIYSLVRSFVHIRSMDGWMDEGRDGEIQ